MNCVAKLFLQPADSAASLSVRFTINRRRRFQILVQRLHLLGNRGNPLETCNMKQGLALEDQWQMRSPDEDTVNGCLHNMFRMTQRCGNASDDIAPGHTCTQFMIRTTGFHFQVPESR